ncbi:MAG: hypothetical protein IJ151_01160 [Bacteroidales bacterium]|nr:hypothetical protein [Bacteroidales bacterium]
MKKTIMLLLTAFFLMSCSSSSKDDGDGNVSMDKAIEIAASYINSSDMATIYKYPVPAGTELCTEAEPPVTVKSPDFEAWMIMLVPDISRHDYYYDLVFVNSESGKTQVTRNVLPDLRFRKASDVKFLKQPSYSDK